MAEENINIRKKLYSKSDVDSFLDISFSEVANIENKSISQRISNFFKDYNDLFYDIGKEGENSHKTLFNQSKEYLTDFYDPKDDQIDALLERIEELEDEIDEINENREHPIDTDGTFIKVSGVATVYFMYRGQAYPLKRPAYNILRKKYYPTLEPNDYSFIVRVDSTADLPPRPAPVAGNRRRISGTLTRVLRDGKDIKELF